MSRRQHAFWFVWCVVFGAWNTKLFAQFHDHLTLACGLLMLVGAALHAGWLWGRR